MRNRWLCRALALAAALMLVCSGAYAQRAVVDNGSDPGSRLNMRSAPSRDAASIGKFFSGTEVEIISDAGNGWAEVEIGSGRSRIHGYMMREYLKSGAAVDATRKRKVVSPYGTPAVVLRDRASNSYDAVLMLQVGDTVTQIGMSGDFCYVITSDLSVGCLLSSELK